MAIADALHIPRDRQADFKRWSDNRVRMIGAAMTEEDQLDIARSEVERQQFFHAAFAERRSQPRDDLMTDLVEARLVDEDDRALTDEELMAIIGQVLAAGNESTTKTLTELLNHLSARPGLWAWLREDPKARAPELVDEGLRMACPFQVLLRVTTEATVVGGVEIPAGAIVAMVVGSAARDESVFDDPEQFLARGPAVPDSLAFGSGIHRCVGAALARLELTVALEELARRLVRLEATPGNAYVYDASFIIRGMSRLELVAATSGGVS
jgi:cytochrome P450